MEKTKVITVGGVAGGCACGLMAWRSAGRDRGIGGRNAAAGLAASVDGHRLHRGCHDVPGQEVQGKFDAFTRCEALLGWVAAISSDVVAGGTLDRQAMEAEGCTVLLASSMMATVDIRTGKRRLVDYLLASVRRYRTGILGEGEGNIRNKTNVTAIFVFIN